MRIVAAVALTGLVLAVCPDAATQETRHLEGIPAEERSEDPYLDINPDHLVWQIQRSLELLATEITFEPRRHDPRSLFRLGIAFDELSRIYNAHERAAYDDAMRRCVESGSDRCFETVVPDFSNSEVCARQALIHYEDLLEFHADLPWIAEVGRRARILRGELGWIPPAES